MARSWCFSIECSLQASSLLDEVVIASDVVLGGVAGGDVLAVTSFLDGVVIECDVVLRGVSGQDLLAATSLLDEVVIESDVVPRGVLGQDLLAVTSLQGGVAGGGGSDDMALTDVNRLEGALVKGEGPK